MIAVYPGSFDPVTFGHIDIMKRASKFVDKLIVAVLNNSSKTNFFTIEERISQLTELTKDIPNIEVRTFSGLLVDFVKGCEARIIIRGLRAVTDFEYEFQMALANKSLDGDIETLFISTSLKHLYLSSSIVREIAKYGGNIDAMVPKLIKDQLYQKNNN